MIRFYTKTHIGYLHTKENRICQDYSSCYHDEERTIVTSCDGHGGKIYVRSHIGSKCASQAVISVLSRLQKSSFYKFSRDDIAENIRLNILCEWNRLVESNLAEKGISKKEVMNLTESEIFKLKNNPIKAYGTTLHGAMVFGNKIICVSLGDGACLAIKKGKTIPVFEDDDDTVANVTHSMCEEEAYNHLRVKIFDFTDVDGVIICTDGLINPYQSISNFNDSFVKPIVAKLLEGRDSEIEEYIELIGSKIGLGDDVSIGIILKDSISIRNYKR